MEWIARAPSIQEKVFMAQIIKDEVRHASIFYHCLEELGVDVENRVKELDQAYDLTHKEKNVLRNDDGRWVHILNFGIETWVEFVVMGFCLEHYVFHEIADAGKSSYNPVARACQSILKEEIMHVRHGGILVERLAKDSETRQEVQQALDKWFPRIMNKFGPVDSPTHKILYRKWMYDTSNV